MSQFQVDSEEEEKVEIKILKTLLEENTSGVFLVDLSLSGQEGEIFKGDFIEMLKAQGLLMDHLIYLKGSEQASLQRLVDPKKIQMDLEDRSRQRQQKITEKTQARREEIYKEKVESGEEVVMEEIEVDPESLGVEELPAFEEELANTRERVSRKREEQIQFAERLIETLKEQSSQVFEIETFLKEEKIWERILSKIRALENYYRNFSQEGQVTHI